MAPASIALAVGSLGALLQAITVVWLLVVVIQLRRKHGSCLAWWCWRIIAAANKWLGKVSLAKPHIKAYREIQRTILRRSCLGFVFFSSFRLLRIQVSLANDAEDNDVYLAFDIPVLIGYAMSLTVLLSSCRVTPLALDTLHAICQILVGVIIYLSETDDLQTLHVVTLALRVVPSLWVQHGWKAVAGHCLCSGILWWRDWVLAYQAFSAFALLTILTWTLHGAMSVLAEQQTVSKTKRVSMESAISLMYSICDCVVELDSSGRLLEDSPQLGTMLFCENSAATMAGAEFLELVLSEDRERVETFLLGGAGLGAPCPTLLTKLIDSAGTQIKIELLQITFFSNGASCLLMGVRESPDFTGSTVSPLRTDTATLMDTSADGPPVIPDYSVVFDAVTFEILVASDEFENLFVKCTGHISDFEKMSIYDLSPDVGETSLSRRIQSAVNSFDHRAAEATVVLGSFNLFGVCTMKAILELENDPALGTLVGTLRCMEHREQPAKKRTSSQNSARRRERTRRRSLTLKALQSAPPMSPRGQSAPPMSPRGQSAPPMSPRLQSAPPTPLRLHSEPPTPLRLHSEPPTPPRRQSGRQSASSTPTRQNSADRKVTLDL